MPYNDMTINIVNNRVTVKDAATGDVYDYSTLITQSIAPAFEALPDGVRRYVKKDTGQEFQVIENGRGGLSQVAPDASYSAMVQSFVADLATHIENAELVSRPAFAVDTDGNETAYAGVPFAFDIETNVALPVDITLSLNFGQSSVLQIPLTLTEGSTTVELIFSQIGGFNLTLNGTFLFNLEIMSL